MSKISITSNASGTGVFTISSPATNTDRTLTLPDEAGTVLTNATTTGFPAGSVLQVVNATYAVQVNNTTNTMVDTGLTATITPTSASSKILVLISQNGCQKPAFDTTINLRLLRGATEILLFGRYVSGNGGAAQANLTSVSASFLDSPATTSATTYKTQFNNDTPAGTCNVQFGSVTFPASTITLMEIAA
jgi:hypothetical protein